MADFVTSERIPEWYSDAANWNNAEESDIAFNATGHDASITLPYLSPIEDIPNIDPELTSIHSESSTSHSSTIHVSQTLLSPAADQIAPSTSYRQRKQKKAAPYPSETNGFTKPKGRRARSWRGLNGDSSAHRFHSSRMAGDATIEIEHLLADRQNGSSQPPRRELSQFPDGITGITSNNTATASLQSPSTIFAMDTSSSTEDTGGLECRLELEEIDFQSLAPDSLLTDNLINAVLSLLTALAPCSLLSVDSRMNHLDLNMVQKVLLNSGTILCPIYISSSGPSLGHWLLAVLNSNGAHIELSMNNSHAETAKARIIELFPHTTSENINATKCVWQEIDRIDSGVAVLVKAFCIALGVELPQTLDAKLWRDVLDLLLRVALDQPYHLAWVDVLVGDAVAPEIERGGPMSLTAARDTFTLLKQFYHSELVRLEQQTATLIQQGRPIYMVLEGLSILSEEQAKRLELERNKIIKCLSDLDKWQETFRGGSLTGEEVLGYSQCRLKELLKTANMYIARRRRMDIAVSKSTKLVGEAIKELDGFQTRPTDLEG